MHSQLCKMLNMDNNWHVSGCHPPNELALKNADYVLENMGKLVPTHISPSSDEGVCISFEKDDLYADIECYNIGEILAMTSSDNGNDIWEVNDIKETVDKIVKFMTTTN